MCVFLKNLPSSVKGQRGLITLNMIHSQTIAAPLRIILILPFRSQDTITLELGIEPGGDI